MTDQEWLKQMDEREDKGFMPESIFVHPSAHPYLREEAAAREMGLHPHEARPRSGPTFLHERLTALRAAYAHEEHIQTLNQGVRELLEQACVLVDGWGGWYFRCRHCQGRGPQVGLKHQAHEDHIEHKLDCVAVRMRDLVTSWITRL